MKKKRMLFFISSLTLLGSGTIVAEDSLHFADNPISKSRTPVINDSQLAGVHFPVIATGDLMSPRQPEWVSLVFRLKNYHNLTLFNVRVMLTGIEDSALPSFLVFDFSSSASGVGIGIETAVGILVLINNTIGVMLPLNQENSSLNFNAWLQVRSGRDVASRDFSATVMATFEYF